MIDGPFGPVALIRPFAGDEDAIAEANRLPYGLAAYCFTESGRRQNVLAEAVETGMLAINQPRMTWPDSPICGVQETGLGSEEGAAGMRSGERGVRQGSGGKVRNRGGREYL